MSQITITSFGYLPGEPPEAELTADLRRHFRDPFFDPALRHLTARSQVVRDAVMATPGIVPLIAAMVAAAEAYLSGPSAAVHPLRMAAGCAGGHHRAPTVAEQLGIELRARGWDVRVEHRDIDAPAEAGR